MRLTFSTANHMNSDISDERGCTYYTISTSSAFNKVTTIIKYNWDDTTTNSVPETVGIIEWHRRKPTIFHFDGKVVPVEKMFKRSTWSSSRCFVGPDRQTYKWKITPHCWMKPAHSNVELVRFHKKNLGILKPSHPAYLDVSDRVLPMLDYIILTFVYMEDLRISQQSSRGQGASASAGVMSDPVFAVPLPSPPPPPPPPPCC